MTSYDHLPPPLDNVAQGSNTFRENEDNLSANVSNRERMNRNDISSKLNTSTKPNTSTKSNISSQDESSNIQ